MGYTLKLSTSNSEASKKNAIKELRQQAKALQADNLQMQSTILDLQTLIAMQAAGGKQ